MQTIAIAELKAHLSAEVKKAAAGAYRYRDLKPLVARDPLAIHDAEETGGLSVFSHERAMNLCARALGMRAPFLAE